MLSVLINDAGMHRMAISNRTSIKLKHTNMTVYFVVVVQATQLQRRGHTWKKVANVNKNKPSQGKKQTYFWWSWDIGRRKEVVHGATVLRLWPSQAYSKNIPKLQFKNNLCFSWHAADVGSRLLHTFRKVWASTSPSDENSTPCPPTGTPTILVTASAEDKVCKWVISWMNCGYYHPNHTNRATNLGIPASGVNVSAKKQQMR